MEKRIKQKDIKSMIINGSAVDVTHWTDKQLYSVIESAERVERPFYSVGVYGCNGAVISCDGKLYAVACRCSNMFILL